jgi:general secretion pathway protein N
MRRGFTIGLTLLALSVHDVAPAAAVSSDALDADLADEARPNRPPAVSSAPAEPVTTVRVVAPPGAPARTPSANPLWALPLSQLPVTRDRPIFSPSRRPPPPAIAAEPVPAEPPPRKKEAEPPQLSLVGTIASDDGGFGIFLDQSTNAALRLKIGENHQGWQLRAIRSREVTMEKGDLEAVLALPQPGGGQPTGEVHPLPVSAVERPVASRMIRRER